MDNRKCDKLFKFMQQELRLSGLQQKFITNSEDNSYDQLQKIIREMIFYLEQPDENMKGQLQAQIKNNQIIIIECLKNFLTVNQQMIVFSKLLYEQECPIQVFKSFRKLYETVNFASNTLYQFQSEDINFMQQKQDLITKNLSISQQIFKTSAINDNNNQTDSKQDFQNQNQLISELKQQIDALNDILRQNDQEFAAQIQKYNNTLYDLQQTIREYELRMDKVRDYENIIDELEHKIIRFKEQKYRDQMLIDNMSKKIRIYQRQRGGSDIFVSPRASRRQMGSPVSKIMNTSNTCTNPYQLKSRNYSSKILSSPNN